MLNTLKNYIQIRHVTLKCKLCNIRATCLSYSVSLQQFLETEKDFTNTNLYAHVHMLKASSKELASGLIINRSLVIILLQLVDIVTKSDLACSDFTNVFNMYDTKGFFIGVLVWHFYKCINRKWNHSSLPKEECFLFHFSLLNLGKPMINMSQKATNYHGKPF